MYDEMSEYLTDKLRRIVKKIIPEIDKAEYYRKYRLYLPMKDWMTETQIIDKHVTNWLYTIKCETGSSGLKYIDTVLFALKKTLDRDMDELQYLYVKTLIFIFLKERKKWMI